MQANNSNCHSEGFPRIRQHLQPGDGFQEDVFVFEVVKVVQDLELRKVELRELLILGELGFVNFG